jgi:propionyl-CoA synthetase
MFDAQAGVYGRWFVGAECNVCSQCVDRHVTNGRADQVALIHDSPMTKSVTRFTYAELKTRSGGAGGRAAGSGRRQGRPRHHLHADDRGAAFAMLACARLGAVHSVVFGGFAARELATRIDDAKPKVIISASCGLEPGRVVAYKPLLDGAIELASHKP